MLAIKLFPYANANQMGCNATSQSHIKHRTAYGLLSVWHLRNEIVVVTPFLLFPKLPIPIIRMGVFDWMDTLTFTHVKKNSIFTIYVPSMYFEILRFSSFRRFDRTDCRSFFVGKKNKTISIWLSLWNVKNVAKNTRN